MSRDGAGVSEMDLVKFYVTDGASVKLTASARTQATAGDFHTFLWCTRGKCASSAAQDTQVNKLNNFLQ